MTLHITPLSPALGAVVEGIDPSRPLEASLRTRSPARRFWCAQHPTGLILRGPTPANTPRDKSPARARR